MWPERKILSGFTAGGLTVIASTDIIHMQLVQINMKY